MATGSTGPPGTVLWVFVKICGLTDPADAVAAAEAGADAIGMIFAPSRRQVSVEEAIAIAAAVPAEVLTVGVFRDHLASEVIEVADAVGLGAVQLHGSEPPELSHRVRDAVATVIKAVSVSDPELSTIDEHRADIVLLDAPVPGGGVPFDWTLVGDLTSRHRILLAGGLRPETVTEAIETVRPWGVDVASGVESVPGRKDHAAVARFVAAARAAGPVDAPLASERNRA